jgi:uncharacterized membrane protein
MSWRGSSATVGERLLASLPYLLPLLESLGFSGPFFELFPSLQIVLLPLAPLFVPIALIYSQVPFASFVIFLALFFLVVRNERILHFIRFNTMQALLIGIMLSIAGLMLSILGKTSGLELIVNALQSTAFLGAIAAVVFSVVQTLRGIYAEIPTISDAVHTQVR